MPKSCLRAFWGREQSVPPRGLLSCAPRSGGELRGATGCDGLQQASPSSAQSRADFGKCVRALESILLIFWLCGAAGEDAHSVRYSQRESPRAGDCRIAKMRLRANWRPGEAPGSLISHTQAMRICQAARTPHRSVGPVLAATCHAMGAFQGSTDDLADFV